MRTQIIRVVWLMGIIILFSSCLKRELEDIEPAPIKPQPVIIKSNEGFEYKLVNTYTVSALVHSDYGKPIDGVYVEYFLKMPLKSDGTLKENIDKYKVFNGSTDESGMMNFSISPPSYSDSLFALVYFVGIERLHRVALNRSNISINIRNSTTYRTGKQKRGAPPVVPVLVNGYYALGTWNSNGVPDYLESQDDLVSSELLTDINASLPESSRLPDSHPQYLENSDDANLVIIDDCEVWVTFVHEGAGWHNSLGYYTYPTNNPPQSINDINDLTIIFPDVSKYSGGLQSGNKVQIHYLDINTNTYSNTFPSGVSIGWFLIAQGWSSSSSSVSQGIYRHFSNTNLNVESDPSLQKHNVLLYDDQRELLILGFEDIRRDNAGCDQDFNDAVFYTTANPITAIESTNYQTIDTPTDSDNDGVSDVFDQYPNDPKFAYNNYYPSQGNFGSLVYEDLWPYKGDYDFNDLVIDYNFNQVTDGSNQIAKIEASYVVRAIGATYHNAFGVELNISPSDVSSVSGQLNTKGYLNISSNGTENNQSKAVVMFFDDAYNALPYPGTGVSVNTIEGNPYVTPDTFYVDINLHSSVSFNTIGTPPYNPFIVVDRNRDVEVHLPNLEPTDLVDQSILGTGDDNSDLNASKYYVSDVYLPWAINLPSSFDYPAEKKSIKDGYVKFNSWATSFGYNYMDWYVPKAGYRSESKIYSK